MGGGECHYCGEQPAMWLDVLCQFCVRVVRWQGYWCRRCESYRVQSVNRLCPVCEDEPVGRA
jgi:hypothetical protein